MDVLPKALQMDLLQAPSLTHILGCQKRHLDQTGFIVRPFHPDCSEVSPALLDFEVTAPLPNVTGPIARSFAGNVGVNRADHPNATLFFWAFEKENGTLTGNTSDTDPWIICLNGGLFLLSRYSTDSHIDKVAQVRPV